MVWERHWQRPAECTYDLYQWWINLERLLCNVPWIYSRLQVGRAVITSRRMLFSRRTPFITRRLQRRRRFSLIELRLARPRAEPGVLKWRLTLGTHLPLIYHLFLYYYSNFAARCCIGGVQSPLRGVVSSWRHMRIKGDGVCGWGNLKPSLRNFFSHFV